MKICSRCRLEKPLSDFNKKGGNGWQSNCRTCQREWYSEYYQKAPKEKDRLLKRNAEHRQRLRDVLIQRKSVPCADCGLSYPPYVMDFDHRDPSKKLFNIGAKVGSGVTLKKLLAEIEKCDVVCANCHRERTHGPVCSVGG